MIPNFIIQITKIIRLMDLESNFSLKVFQFWWPKIHAMEDVSSDTYLIVICFENKCIYLRIKLYARDFTRPNKIYFETFYSLKMTSRNILEYVSFIGISYFRFPFSNIINNWIFFNKCSFTLWTWFENLSFKSSLQYIKSP